MSKELSGIAWCERFPTDRTTASLAEPFQTNVERFITALEKAGAHVKISATRRPKERAYLMRCAWDIAVLMRPAREMPAMEGVDIEWDHGSADASWSAANRMVQVYGLVHRPSLTSRHIDGQAIDMRIIWTEPLQVVNGKGETVDLPIGGLETLYQIGASYGVHKLRTDPPHWSVDGR